MAGPAALVIGVLLLVVPFFADDLMYKPEKPRRLRSWSRATDQNDVFFVVFQVFVMEFT